VAAVEDSAHIVDVTTCGSAELTVAKATLAARRFERQMAEPHGEGTPESL